MTFHKTQVYLVDGQIAVILAVDQVLTPLVNGTGTSGNRPNIYQDHRQFQAPQPIRVAQHGTLQIKTITRYASGVAAILLWRTAIAFSRKLTEQLGTLIAAMGIYLLAGGFGFFYTKIMARDLRQIKYILRRYLWGCGSLFVAHICVFYLAIGLAASREQGHSHWTDPLSVVRLSSGFLDPTIP